MRGKRRLKGSANHRPRIIPARAGQTSPSSPAISPATDHPRACGANGMDLNHGPLGTGSSPRVRGKRSRWGFPFLRNRIIPARAGQTGSWLPQEQAAPDHPRACGANCHWCVHTLTASGSSPRVRGKPRCVTCRTLRHRIIPARAGQTRWQAKRTRRNQDHPRACGANPKAIE